MSVPLFAEGFDPPNRTVRFLGEYIAAADMKLEDVL